MPPKSSTDSFAGLGQKTKNHRKSSFLVLSQQAERTIPQIQVSLEGISYTPPTANSKKSRAGTANTPRTLVLDNIHTQINPFELTAWMGPSGSGKTSLTSVVAGLMDPSDVTGTMRVNHDATSSIPKQMVGVVWQDDLLLSNLTVEETIYFAARLKTPSSVTDETVRILVEETMRELGLLHVRSSLIGSVTGNGSRISGGERKRTAVAQELVVRPSLLLLDEPTSGLDATTAYSLVKTLKDLASLGHSIALVIHQPRTDIYNMLDRLLLLSKGKVVFEGHPKNVRSYLETVASPLPPETGIADWIMDTIIADEQRQKQQDGGKESYVCLADHWNAEQGMLLSSNTETDESSSDHPPNSSDDDHHQYSLARPSETRSSAYEASFGRELSMLTGRISKQQRGDKLTRVTCLLTLVYLVFTSFMYFRLPNDTANIFERNSLIFFMLIAQGNGIVTSSIAVFNRERALLRRERAKKMYRVLPFFLAKAASDMTNNILLPMVYGIITYWTAGMRPSATAFFRFVLGYYLTLSCAQSMGFFLSILYPNMAIAMILAPPITLFMFICGGFYIPFNNMHVAMRGLSYVSFARYGYSALLVNEYEGRLVPCYDSDTNDGEEFTGITIAGTSECPLPGDSIYEGIGIDGVFANYWFNIGMIAIFQSVFLIGAYALLKRSTQ